MASDIRLQDRCMTYKQTFIPLHELYRRSNDTPVSRKRTDPFGRQQGLKVGGSAVVNSPECPAHQQTVQIKRLMRNTYSVVVLFNGGELVLDGSELEAA